MRQWRSSGSSLTPLRQRSEIAKKRGITPENKVQLVHGIGSVVAVLREVAGELERRMREFEAEES